MNKDLLIAILSLACLGLAAAFLVTLAKLQEEKEKRWDDTSVFLSEIKHMSCLVEVNEYIISVQKEMLRDYLHELQKGQRENHDLQLRLSAILCPTNNHVWKDGRCAKCGRMKDAAD